MSTYGLTQLQRTSCLVVREIARDMGDCAWSPVLLCSDQGVDSGSVISQGSALSPMLRSLLEWVSISPVGVVLLCK